MTAISSIDSNLSELIANATNATNATNADLAVRSKVWEWWYFFSLCREVFYYSMVVV
jgi:hypothetical protein